MELQSVLQLVLQEKKNIVRPSFQNLSREDNMNCNQIADLFGKGI